MNERLAALTLADWIFLGVFFGASIGVMDALSRHAQVRRLVTEAEGALRG